MRLGAAGWVVSSTVGLIVAGCGGGGGGGGGVAPPATPSAGTLTLVSVSPTIGSTSGGTTLTLAGRGFVTGSTVRLGGTRASNVTVVSSTQIQATTPPGTAGTVDLLVRTPAGEESTLRGVFTYVSPPDGAPTDLRATVLSQSQVRIEWTDTSSNETSFEIERRDAGGSVQTTAVGPGVTELVDLTVAPNTAYEYRVRARNLGGDSAYTASVAAFTNLPPVITVDMGLEWTVRPFSRVVARVTAMDPEGDPITLSLLNPPAGAVFTPALSQGSPVSRTLRWSIHGSVGSFGALEFLARGPVGPAARARVTYRLEKPVAYDPLAVGDVTGDGLLDVVVIARLADDSTGSVDVGAVFVWSGSTQPTGAPTAVLRSPRPRDGGRFGEAGVWLADVTGDSTLDVIVPDPLGGPSLSGTVEVWAGGASLAGSPAPVATLEPPSAADSVRPNIEVGDVDGDGRADVIAPGEVFGTGAAGALFVYRGGVMTGPTTPSVTLADPAAAPGDDLGGFGGEVLLADVTDDGVLDVVAVTPLADDGPVQDTGAVHVWTGGPTLLAATAPTATLRVPGAAREHLLGVLVPDLSGDHVTYIVFADVSGDGVPDLVVPAGAADGTEVDVGAVHVWRGGATLTGALAPWATLQVAGATAGDALGFGNPYGLIVGDVTGDAVFDLVVASGWADVAGRPNAGAIYVWTGGATLAGAPAVTATLTDPSSDRLGWASAVGEDVVQLGDVDGDGIDDVVVSAPLHDDLATDAGAVLVWRGGASLTGAPAPDSILRAGAQSAQDQVGLSRLVDLTGDGVVDVIAVAPFAQVGVEADAGAIHVWTGGTSILSSPPPSTSLHEPTPTTTNVFGFTVSYADLTGDGELDLVVPVWNAEVGATANAGAIYVYAGGAPIIGATDPTATLIAPVGSRADDDRLGQIDSMTTATLFADLTGDGVVDVVSAASQADVGAATDAGRLFVWAGGAALSGAVEALATMVSPSPAIGDRLPYAGPSVSSQPLFLADLTGDGAPDVIAVASYADAGVVSNAGAVHVWAAGLTLTGSPPALATWTIPNARADDLLGNR